MSIRVVRFAATAALMVTVACTQQPQQTAAPAGQAASAPSKDAPPPAKKAHVFRGKVEKIDPATKSLTVNGEDVEGWMGAMTMVYKVDKADVIGTIAVGDQITATVYDGDLGTLYDVKRNPEKPKQ